MRRIEDPEYVRDFVMPYNYSNLYTIESVNDFFLYNPTDIENQVKNSTPETGSIAPKGTPGSVPHTVTAVVDGVPTEVLLGEAINLAGDNSEGPSTPSEPITDKKLGARGKGANSTFGRISGGRGVGFQANKGRRKFMNQTAEFQTEPMATVERDAIDTKEV